MEILPTDLHASPTKTVCYFGDYQISGRGKVLRQAVERAGYSIIDCHSTASGIRFFIELFTKHRALVGTYDILFIGNSGPSYFLPLFAKLLTTKPVVWEPLFSIYDNYVFDRKYVSRFSLKAFCYFLMDFIGSQVSDCIILDTDTNGTYFSKTFHIPKKKCAVVLTGADTSIFKPIEFVENRKNFEVEFHGKYIPVHGTEVIVNAAKILASDPEIHFTMIGKGQMYAETVALADSLRLKNMTFLPFMPQEEVVSYIAQSDVSIGLLGDVPRIVRAIPGKLYEAAAIGRVSINADTPALREVFTSGHDVVGVPQGDPQALADAILQLKQDGVASKMGKNARQTFLEKATVDSLSISVKNIFNSLCRVHEM